MKSLFVFILIVVFAFVPASAQKLGYNGFSVHGNLVFPEDHNLGFGAGGSVNMGELSDGINAPAIGFDRLHDLIRIHVRVSEHLPQPRDIGILFQRTLQVFNHLVEL